MENLDGTIIVTALPAIAGDFGVRVTDASIGITSYVLMVAITIPASGWVSDRFGARNVFCAAVALFTGASILCVLSNTLVEFTGARILQGVGAALMSPVGRLVALRGAEKRELMRAIATITWPGLVAPVIAPPIGGLITTYASWHWIFLINVPFGVVGILVALWSIPNDAEAERTPFDRIGFVLGGVTMASLLFGLDLLGHSQDRALFACAVLSAGMIALVLLLRHSQRYRHALLDLRLLDIPTFSTSTLGGSFTRIALNGTPFLLPLMFQLGFGLSPFDAGVLVFFYMFGNLSMKAVTTPVLQRFGFRSVLLVNGVLLSLSIVAFAAFSPTIPTAVIAGTLLAGGMIRSLQFTCLNTLAFADVPPRQRPAATMLATAMQHLSNSLAVGVAALSLNLAHVVPHVQATSLTAFAVAFLVLASFGVLAMPFFWKLAKDAGAEVTGRYP